MRHTTDFSGSNFPPLKKAQDYGHAAKRFFWHRFGLCAPRPSVLLAFLWALIFVVPAGAQNASEPEHEDALFGLPSRQHLFGDWGGERTALAKKGINFDFFYIADLEANSTGGLQQSNAGWERSRGTLDISFDRMISWQGLSVHATGLWQTGPNLGGKIGTLANSGDLVSAHTTRLDSFWVQQLFFRKETASTRGAVGRVGFLRQPGLRRVVVDRADGVCVRESVQFDI
jgi:carbohydrate-selective porin OprB